MQLGSISSGNYRLEPEVKTYSGLKRAGVLQDRQVIVAEIGRQKKYLSHGGAQAELAV